MLFCRDGADLGEKKRWKSAVPSNVVDMQLWVGKDLRRGWSIQATKSRAELDDDVVICVVDPVDGEAIAEDVLFC